MALYRCVGGGASGTAITPDNTASPPALTQGETYTITGNNGVAIESYSSVSPSNTSPKTLSSGNYYRASSSGYAISSYASTSVTPSSAGVQFSSGWNRMTAGGYAYTAQIPKRGSVTISGISVDVSINTGLSSINGFIAWGISNLSYGDSLQEVVRYAGSSSFYYCSHYGTAGDAGYSNFITGTTGMTRALGMKSISGGTVKLITSKTTNWGDLKITWFAW